MPGTCPILDKQIVHLTSLHYYDFHHIIGPTWTSISTSGHISLKPDDHCILLRFPPSPSEEQPANSDYADFTQYVESINAPSTLKRRASNDGAPVAKRHASYAYWVVLPALSPRRRLLDMTGTLFDSPRTAVEAHNIPVRRIRLYHRLGG